MAKASKAEAKKATSARETEREELLGAIRIYLTCSSKNPIEDWRDIRSDIDEGLGLSPLRERHLETRVELANPTFKDEPMPKPTTTTVKADDSDEPLRSVSLRELLNAVVENPEAWLSMPSAQFGGRKPSDLIGTEEEHKIVDLLLAVDQGLF